MHKTFWLENLKGRDLWNRYQENSVGRCGLD